MGSAHWWLWIALASSAAAAPAQPPADRLALLDTARTAAAAGSADLSFQLTLKAFQLHPADMGPPADLASSPEQLERKLAEVFAAWNAAQLDPERIRQTLLEIVLPENRPNEIRRIAAPITGRSSALAEFEPSAGLLLAQVSTSPPGAAELAARLTARYTAPSAAADALIVAWQLAVLAKDPSRIAAAAVAMEQLQPTQLTPVTLEVLAFWIHAAEAVLLPDETAVCSRTLERLLPAALAVPASSRCWQHLAGLAFRLARSKLLDDQPQQATVSLHLADVLAERAATAQTDVSARRFIMSHHREAARLLVLAGPPDAAAQRLELCRTLLPQSDSPEADAAELAALVALLPNSPGFSRFKLLQSLLTSADGNRLIMPALVWPPALPTPALAGSLPQQLKQRALAYNPDVPISPLSELVQAAIQAQQAEPLAAWLRAASERGHAPARLALALLLLHSSRESEAKTEVHELLRRRRIDDPAELRLDQTLLCSLQQHPTGRLWLYEFDLASLPPQAWLPAIQTASGTSDVGSANGLVWCEDPEFGSGTGPLVRPAHIASRGLIIGAATRSDAHATLPWPVSGPLVFSTRTWLQQGSQAGAGFDGFAAVSAAASERTLATGFGAQTPLVRSGRFQQPGEFGWQFIRSDGSATTLGINGHPLWLTTGPPSAAFPWLFLHVENGGPGVFSQLRLTTPVAIPRSVPLIADRTLTGWSGVRYGQLLPVNRRVPVVPALAATGSPPPAGSRTAFSDWTADEDTIAGRPAARQSPPGELFPTSTLAFIQYQRPLRTGETLSWEFEYQPGTDGDCLALGSVAIRLRPDGVYLHAIPENRDQWTLFPPDREVRQQSATAAPSLVQEGWNRAQLTCLADRAVLTVNDQAVFELPLGPGTDRRPGLSHRRNRMPLRVRRMVLTGNWPTELTSDLVAQATTATPSPQPAIAESLQSFRAAEVLEDCRMLPPDSRLEQLQTWALPGGPTFVLRTPEILPELIRSAITLERLSLLEDRLEAATAAGAAQRIQQAAALTLCAVLNVAPTATERLEQLLNLLREDRPQRGSLPSSVSWLLGEVCRESARTPALHSLTAQLLEISRTLLAAHTQPPQNLHEARLLREAEAGIEALAVQLQHSAATDDIAVDPRSVTAQLRAWHVQTLLPDRPSGNPSLPRAWQPLADGHALLTGGRGEHLLVFPKPLTSDFVCRLRLMTTGSGGRDRAQLPLLGYGGLCWETDLDGKLHEFAWRDELPTHREAIDSAAAVTREEKNEYRIELRREGSRLTLAINDEVLLQQTLNGRQPPWLVIRTGRQPGAILTALELEFTPNPVTTIELPFTPTLPAWNVPAFQNGRVFHPDTQTDADWRVSETRLVGTFRSEAGGSWRPSLLQSTLPLPPQSKLSWSFQYEPGRRLVHPALGQYLLLLEPGDGIYLAQLPAVLRGDQELSRSAVLAASERVPRSQCNLIANQWNQLQLEVNGDDLKLRLNDNPAAATKLSSSALLRPGFFHWSDQTAAEIQSLQLQVP